MNPMKESILNTIKKMLGITPDITVFDSELIAYINSQWMSLQQIGIGPTDGYRIEGDSDTWEEFIEVDTYRDAIQTYVYANVRLLFDPPQTNHAQESLRKIASEAAWRLNVQVETESRKHV